VLDVKTVASKSKLSISLYVELSDSCQVYSVLNHEMGTSPQPMFLSVLVSIMSGLSWEMLNCCSLERWLVKLRYRWLALMWLRRFWRKDPWLWLILLRDLTVLVCWRIVDVRSSLIRCCILLFSVFRQEMDDGRSGTAVEEDEIVDELMVDWQFLKVIVDIADSRLKMRAELCSCILQRLWCLKSFLLLNS